MATIQVMLIKHTLVVNHNCDKMKKIGGLTHSLLAAYKRKRFYNQSSIIHVVPHHISYIFLHVLCYQCTVFSDLL